MKPVKFVVLDQILKALDVTVTESQYAAALTVLDDAHAIFSNSDFDDVGAFHQKFGLDNVATNGVHQLFPSKELVDFRIKFLREELQEFEEAIAAGDMVKAADSLVDLNYVSCGTAHLFGFPWHEIWDEVQRANMAKVRAQRAEESTRGSTFDVVKPKGWTPPDVRGILLKHGWKLELLDGEEGETHGARLPELLCSHPGSSCIASRVPGTRFCTVHQEDK